MTPNYYQARLGLLAALGVATAAVLSGCGGASNNASPAPAATPTIYGVNPTTGATGSGLQSSDAKTGYLTAALSTTAKALEGAIPFGFAAGGLNADAKTVAVAVPAGQTGVSFRTLIANGNAGSGISAIIPSSVVLTSPEVAGFSQPLTFDGASVTLNDGQYTTAAFALPFTTSGIHQFTAAVADASGQNSTTTLGVVVAVPTDVALFLQSFDSGKTDGKTPPSEVFNAITAGDIVQIDGGQGTGVYPTGYAATTADAQATVVLFTAPGAHTVTEFKPDGKTVVQTSTFTLPAAAAGTTLYAVPAPAATTVAAVSKPHLVKRH